MQSLMCIWSNSSQFCAHSQITYLKEITEMLCNKSSRNILETFPQHVLDSLFITQYFFLLVGLLMNSFVVYVLNVKCHGYNAFRTLVLSVSYADIVRCLSTALGTYEFVRIKDAQRCQYVNNVTSILGLVGNVAMTIATSWLLAFIAIHRHRFV